MCVQASAPCERISTAVRPRFYTSLCLVLCSVDFYTSLVLAAELDDIILDLYYRVPGLYFRVSGQRYKFENGQRYKSGFILPTGGINLKPNSINFVFILLAMAGPHNVF